MGLVGLAESVEASVADLFYTGADLLWRKGMAGTKKMLVLAGAVDEDGLTVEVEAVVATIAQNRPRHVADAEGRTHLVGDPAIPLNHRGKVVEIGVVKAPTMDILYTLHMAKRLALSWLQ